MKPIIAIAIPKNIGVIIPLVFPKKSVKIINIKSIHSNFSGISISYFVIICGINIKIKRKIFVETMCHNEL